MVSSSSGSRGGAPSRASAVEAPASRLADRTVSLESLKRHKDDSKEVREGFECGLKIAGYDDIKVDAAAAVPLARVPCA